VSWFEELYGEPVRRERFPILEIPEGGEVEVEFLEPEPRIVRTRVGPRAVITVYAERAKRSLWLSHKVLARKIAALQLDRVTLNRLKVRIRNLGKGDGYYDYDVEVVE